MTPLLFSDLERDEGLRLKAYADPLTGGKPWTIGYGRAEDVSEGDVWTQDQAVAALHVDVATAVAQLDKALPWWRKMNDVRQDALVELTYNLGIGTLLTFEHALAAMRLGNFTLASAALLDSRWATQVGARATRLAAMMKTGARP